MNVGRNNSMLGRVQRKADASYYKKVEEWNKLATLSNGEKTLGVLETGSKVNDFPVRKITKFFTRG